jgi:hypothetical protein
VKHEKSRFQRVEFCYIFCDVISLHSNRSPIGTKHANKETTAIDIKHC